MNTCSKCFGEESLKRRLNEIASRRVETSCSFHCDEPGVDLATVRDIFHEAFSNNYSKGKSGRRDAFRLPEAITNLMQPENLTFVDVLVQELINKEKAELFGPAFYETDALYENAPTGSIWNSYLWIKFTDSVLHEQRFFNSSARQRLNEIFRNVEKQRSVRRRSPIYFIEPGKDLSRIKRARLAEDGLSEKIKGNPYRELCAPPQRLSMSGRLNPSGIPVFYGAYDVETCVAEIRAPVGSSFYCADFEISKPICVLDTTLFEEEQKSLSIFARHQNLRRDQWLFMRQFMQEISKPVTPNKEHLDYIPTQIVAEFLKTCFKIRVNQNQTNIDAIIYSSSQKKGGKNIAIFLPYDPRPNAIDSENSDDPSRLRLTLRSYDCYRVQSANFIIAPDFDPYTC